MSINQLNLVIGVLVGLALGILLQRGTPLTDNDKAAEWRQPMRKAAGQ